MAEASLDENEMVRILEEIARDSGNAAARIAAIKQLREMSKHRDDSDKTPLTVVDNLAERRAS